MEESLGKSVAKGGAKFLVGLLMVLLAIAINVVVFCVGAFQVMSFMEPNTALILGIVLSIIYAAVVFLIPFLREMKMVRYWAILAVGDALYWAYLLIS